MLSALSRTLRSCCFVVRPSAFHYSSRSTVVGGAAVDADARPDFGSNRAAAASAGDSVLVSGVLTGGEGRCWNTCNPFGYL